MGHRRQLYRCVPANGDRPHRFTELLPREEAWHEACETASGRCTCARGRSPLAARRYQFVAPGIVEALVAVGAGTSYRQAGLVARERARRLRADPQTGEPRMTRHGQLAGDWVEVFAPVVFEPQRPDAWLLMQLQANGQADPLAYAKSIRAWLEANGGRPPVTRRAVTDPDGFPSLR